MKRRLCHHDANSLCEFMKQSVPYRAVGTLHKRKRLHSQRLLNVPVRERFIPPNKKDLPQQVFFVWWGKVDSNHRSQRQQIYSLPPLATREFPHIYALPCLTAIWILPHRCGLVKRIRKKSTVFFAVSHGSICLLQNFCYNGTQAGILPAIHGEGYP